MAASWINPLLERALAICEKVLGTEHPYTNFAGRNLARVHLAVGDSAGTLTLAEATLSAHEVVGASHRWTKDSARVTADALEGFRRPHVRDRDAAAVSRLEFPGTS